MNKYLIIESEENLINRIKNVLDNFSDFHYLGYASEDSDCMDIILREMPDLVFINIDNTVDAPFYFVKEVNQYLKKEIVFIAISSSKNKTYEAIKSGFFDYLLAPTSDLEIRKTALKFKKKHPAKTNKIICIKSYKDYQYIDAEEILFLKADNNTTDFYINNGNVISAYKTLKTFENKLPKNFLRVHKSYIVNKDYVRKVSYSKLNCTLKETDIPVPFSKTYIENVEDMVSDLS